MRFLFLFHFLLSSVFLSKMVLALDKPLGILVKVKTEKVLKSKKFKDLILKNKLLADRYYPTLKIQSFKTNSKSSKDFKSLCKTIEKSFPDVLSCELNLVISPQSSSDDCHSGSIPSVLGPRVTRDVDHVLDNTVCKLLTTINAEDHQRLELGSALSPYWAQEYIGADLLKEEMSEKKSIHQRLKRFWEFGILLTQNMVSRLQTSF